MVELVRSGRIYRQTKFRDTPEALRRLKDIAISGDGEPTTCRNFGQAVATCAEVLRRHELSGVKLVLITNGSLAHLEPVQSGLRRMARVRGEVWFKLDAATDEALQMLLEETPLEPEPQLEVGADVGPPPLTREDLGDVVEVDTDTLDVAAYDTTTSGSVPYLSQTKSVSPTSVAPGDDVQYTITIDNIGGGPTGSPVEILFDVLPGQVFDGEIRSIGLGVSQGQAQPPGTLPTIQNSRDWLRQSQRFPVIIGFDVTQQPALRGQLRVGGQASVMAYGDGHGLLGPLAKAYVRLMSWLSYAY